jgi:exodeoxyribonuclease-3
VKISSWNVNGLRAVLRKGDWFQFANTDPGDIICLQEIKMTRSQLNEEQITLFEPYHQYWFPAERGGYSGVLTLAKFPPKEVCYGLGDPAFDQEGRTIQAKFENFWLINVYVPNGKRDHSRVGYKLAFYELLLDVCLQRRQAGYEVIICGDINTAHEEIDLKNARENQNTTGFLPEERAWITKFVDAGFIDIFRKQHPTVEKYTWWSYVTHARIRNVGWRIDYFLISKGLIDRVKNAAIRDEIPVSDHCPIELSLI